MSHINSRQGRVTRNLGIYSLQLTIVIARFSVFYPLGGGGENLIICTASLPQMMGPTAERKTRRTIDILFAIVRARPRI